jgi:glucosamine--fructose-6-phosphate aminotransferase (isomerizing)
MCGIVGAISKRDITPILIDGLRRLEYRGYDSAGVAVINGHNAIERLRAKGKVAILAEALAQTPLQGHLGIAHTRWATHGVPSERNAHPHLCNATVAVVHNGIIENYQALRESQKALGYAFTSETDTEVIAHQVHLHYQASNDLLEAVRQAVREFEGAYALGVVSHQEPERLIAAREGSPLVIGVGESEYFLASDVTALLKQTKRFIFLEEGDIADIRKDALTIYDRQGEIVDREIKESQLAASATDLGGYPHYMLKEIHEQPLAIGDTLEGRITGSRVIEQSFGPNATEVFDQTERVSIIACGTSYHAGLVAKQWLEAIADIPCSVEVASEFRYRKVAAEPNTLYVFISQSGETADTLSALRKAKSLNPLSPRTRVELSELSLRGATATKQSSFRDKIASPSSRNDSGTSTHTLAICNAPESSLMREAALGFLTRAGAEIGVASTKAFTTQLVALLLLTIALGRRGNLTEAQENELIRQLNSLPRRIEEILTLDEAIKHIAEQFADKTSALFLGRGKQFPIALEGALKLKEISYIHAEAYPAGELKHGPLALVDENMPVIAVAPNCTLLDKLKSNLQEVSARGGKLIVFADKQTKWEEQEHLQIIGVESVEEAVSPITFTIPLQLLSYHVAVLKGTDVDQPRNLAKSVTVE